MTEYLTYDEYNKIGGVLDSAAFNRYSVRAFSRISQETHNRISQMSDVPVAVKHLCRDLIEYMSNNLSQKKALSSVSQSQGGASESESYMNKTAEDIDSDISNLIYDYLASVTDDFGVPLLYRGANR